MNRAPRIAAIHDISGFGRCSMTVVLPVLSAMGGQCCPLPTAWLSAHTGFPQSQQAVFLNMTQQLSATPRHWGELGVTFDAIYSGFLGSEEQIALIEQFHTQFCGDQTLVVVDPVMGDHGKPYRTYSPDMCRSMQRLAEGAHLITPNLTEAALLLGEDYANIPKTEENARRWLERLSLHGKRAVVLTGLSFAAGQVGAGCIEVGSGHTHFAMTQQVPAQFPGTGDLFTAVVLGDMLGGKALPHAITHAVDFVQQCTARTLAMGTPVLEGVQFEGLLKRLMD